jgi:hypothetical protein
MLDVLQVLGAVCVLVPFVWSQVGPLSPRSRAYLAANLAGATILAALALAGRDWGFLLLEGTWAAVAALGLRRLTARSSATR